MMRLALTLARRKAIAWSIPKLLPVTRTTLLDNFMEIPSFRRQLLWVIAWAGVGYPRRLYRWVVACSSRHQARSTSATVQAWAKVPRGSWGASPSKISLRLPRQPLSR